MRPFRRTTIPSLKCRCFQPYEHASSLQLFDENIGDGASCEFRHMSGVGEDRSVNNSNNLDHTFTRLHSKASGVANGKERQHRLALELEGGVLAWSVDFHFNLSRLDSISKTTKACS
ncbi:hypothetical protein MVEG_00468 [Podila verticillata NRRL 6337]|nr:hypothetical protein MVEG_00468 [Podila verticillata NRRL 6337]